MNKQTQSRLYGYVSPKCKIASLPSAMAFCASPQYDDTNNTEILINGEDYDL